MLPPPDPPDGSDTAGTTSLWYDPSTYPTAVAGVASAHNRMSDVVAANSPLTASPVADFGPIGQALAAFHSAWSLEAKSATEALDAMVHLLPAAATNLEHTDQQGGTVVSHAMHDLQP
ncbi:hypothetical protein ACQP2U_24140 [Nocardia sp. CA-084685]|uniref:hypothetical protein n=1 Tax=Nocardia sp. CA-084685 TaxID=3239970 RepID=UPI003D981266